MEKYKKAKRFSLNYRDSTAFFACIFSKRKYTSFHCAYSVISLHMSSPISNTQTPQTKSKKTYR